MTSTPEAVIEEAQRDGTGEGPDAGAEPRRGSVRVRRSGPAGRWALVAGAVLLVLIAAFQILPAPERLATHVAPNTGDPLLVTWILEHQARALLEDPTTLYAGNIFHPEPDAIAWSENLTAFVPAYLAVWVAAGRSSLVAYNVVSWLAFAAGNLAVLWLARRLLRSPEAAVLVAVTFSVAAVRLSAIGHTQLAGVAFLPAALVLVIDVVERQRWRTAVLAGVGLAGLWYSAAYFFVLAAMVVPLLLVTWALRSPRLVTARVLSRLAATGVVTAALVAPTVPIYLSVQERAPFTRTDSELRTLDTSSFLQPASPLYEALDQADTITEGGDAFFSLTVPALAGAGAVLAGWGWWRRDETARRSRRPAGPWTVEDRRRHVAVPLGVTCAFAGLLALGPGAGIASLPYEAARAVVPGLESVRALNRFWVLPVIGVALLAGRALELLVAHRAPALRAVVGCAAVALVLAELVVRPPFAEAPLGPELEAVNRVLAEEGVGPVTELPVPTVPDLPYVLAARQLRSLEDGLPRVEGYSGAVPPGTGAFISAVSAFPGDAAIAALRQAGVRHVVLHGADEACVGRYGPAELEAILAAARTAPAVERVTRAGAGAVVTLTPAPRGGPLTELPNTAQVARTTTSCASN